MSQQTVTELVFSGLFTVVEDHLVPLVAEGKNILIICYIVAHISISNILNIYWYFLLRGRTWYVGCWRDGSISWRFVFIWNFFFISLFGPMNQMSFVTSAASLARFFTCPSGWVRYKNGCYQYVSSGRSWSSAVVIEVLYLKSQTVPWIFWLADGHPWMITWRLHVCVFVCTFFRPTAPVWEPL